MAKRSEQMHADVRKRCNVFAWVEAERLRSLAVPIKNRNTEYSREDDQLRAKRRGEEMNAANRNNSPDSKLIEPKQHR